jgi:hypothetical protein
MRRVDSSLARADQCLEAGSLVDCCSSRAELRPKKRRKVTAHVAEHPVELLWYTFGSGAIIGKDGSDYQLSGSVGQWDAADAWALSVVQLKLPGGVLGLTRDALGNLVFSDRLEADAGNVDSPDWIGLVASWKK